MEITHGPAQLTLLSEHAIYWSTHSALILSDVHLGKSQAFRSHNIPLPEGHTQDDLDRISDLVRKVKATQLIIAGDFIHSPSSYSVDLTDAISAWTDALPCQVTLVSGNHDERAGPLPQNWGIHECSRLDFHGLEIVHQPEHSCTEASISGHLHPVVLLRNRPRAPKLRLPCFWQCGGCLILPAFGSFTGGHPIAPDPNDSVYAIASDDVQKIPDQLIVKKRS